MEKAIILGASSILGLWAAVKSKQSRTNAEEQRTNNLYDPTTSVANAWPQSTPPSTTPQQHRHQSRIAAANILVHSILAIILIASSQHIKPGSLFSQKVTDVIWLQYVSTICIASLGVHSIAALYFSHQSHSHNRRQQHPHHKPTANGGPRTAPLMVGGPTRRVHDLSALNGIWLKDRSLSDSMDAALDLIELHGIVRMAVNLVKGLEIHTTPGEFRFSVLSGVLWFKITERYPLDGEVRKHRRRDLRGGGSFGRVEPAPSGGIYCSNRFSEPLAGSVSEHFYCPLPNLLHVDTVLTVRGKSVSYRQVYHKKDHTN